VGTAYKLKTDFADGSVVFIIQEYASNSEIILISVTNIRPFPSFYGSEFFPKIRPGGRGRTDACLAPVLVPVDILIIMNTSNFALVLHMS
jgi:hypothetical protein